MKTAPVVAAALEIDADGVACSSRYADRYHPRAGAPQQAEHVFLRGNGLPVRWRSRESFTVLETGFGLGNNFLATLAAWRDDAARSTRLHYLAIEKHPFTRADLARAHAGSARPALVDELLRAWPPLTPDLHRLEFDGGRVQLLLAFGDVAAWLPGMVARVDAFYLDGFAPERNPEMWHERVFKALARLAAPGATAATWSVARKVRDGLAAAGFAVERAPGSGAKREITLARHAPRFEPRPVPRRLAAAPVGAEGRDAIVVGAGLAGCALALALAEQGWTSTLLERLPAIASATSGNRAGLFHGVVHAADGPHARFNRLAALHAKAAVRVAIDSHGAPGQLQGVLSLQERSDAVTLRAIVDAQRLPPDCVRALDAAEACELAGLALGSAAWLHGAAGWVEPPALAASLLRRAGAAATVRHGVDVAALRRSGATWQLVDASGSTLAESAYVVLANAGDALRLLGAPSWPVLSVRGQTTTLPAGTPGLRLPRLPLTGHGYVLPALADGLALCGATSQAGDAEPALRIADQRENLARLARLTGSTLSAQLADAAGGRVGWRCVAADRLPILGAVPDPAALGAGSNLRLDQPRLVPRLPGLYVLTALASRGIAWSLLGARSVAALMSGAPCPLDASLLDAVDAGRFAARAARRS